MVDIAVMGDKSLLRAMNNLTKGEFFSTVRKSVRAGAKITLAKTKELAPYETGLLKKALVTRVGKRHRPGSWAIAIRMNAYLTDLLHAASGKVAKGSRRHAMKRGAVGSDYYYPAAQEFGWTKGGRYFPPKHPYMRKAFDQTDHRVAVLIQDTSWRKLVELWQRPKGG